MTRLLIITGAISLFLLTAGCLNPMKGDGFANERYIWEDWTVSTNSINVNTNTVYIAPESTK